MSKLQFQLRGREMNRIEAVSDVVFGFALALLVVSLQVPHTYADLITAMSGFPAFAFTFAALMYVWVRHYYFFRYYGLDDLTTIVLNTVLLFLVLFYVYPLKFLFSVFLVNVWINPLIGMPNQITSIHSGLDPVMTWGKSVAFLSSSGPASRRSTLFSLRCFGMPIVCARTFA